MTTEEEYKELIAAYKDACLAYKEAAAVWKDLYLEASNPEVTVGIPDTPYTVSWWGGKSD